MYTEAVLDRKEKELDFVQFPEGQEMKKKWIHAIRRDVGKFFGITEASRVCSLHSKPTDILKGFWWTFFSSHGEVWQRVFKTL